MSENLANLSDEELLQRYSEMLKSMSDEELQAHYAQLTGDKAPSEEQKPGLTAQQRLLHGAAVPFAELYYGLREGRTSARPGTKSFIDTSGDRANLDALKEKASGAAGGAGELLGNTALYMAPGARVAKGVVNVLKRVFQNAGTAAAIGASKLPQEGESRSENAAQEAAWSVGGDTVGAVAEAIPRAVRAYKRGPQMPNETLARWKREGYRPTPGEAFPALHGAENILRRKPGLSKGLQRMTVEADQSMNRVVMNRAAPPTAESVRDLVNGQRGNVDLLRLDDIGHLGVRRMSDGFNKAYEAAHLNLNDLSEDGLEKIFKELVKLSEVVRNPASGMTKKETRQLAGVADEIVGWLGSNANKSTKEIEEYVMRLASKEDLSSAAKEALIGVKSGLRTALPERNQFALNVIDEQYGKYVAVSNATGTPNAMKSNIIDETNPKEALRWPDGYGHEKGAPVAGAFDESELAAGAKEATLTKRGAGRGDAPLQDTLAELGRVRKGIIPILPDISIRTREAIPDPKGIAYRLMRRTAGNAPSQTRRWAQRTPQQIQADMLRRRVYPAFAAAIGEEEE